MGTRGSSAGRLGRAQYIVYSETGATAPVFTVKGQASQGGRMDVIATSIIAASYDPNPGYTAVLMGPPEPVKILSVRRWGFNTPKQVVVEILSAFKRRSNMINIYSGDPLEPLHMCRRCKILLLEEEGQDISGLGGEICSDALFVLGGHTGFPEPIYDRIASLSHARISIGPVSLQTYQAILYLAWRRRRVCGPSSRREQDTPTIGSP